MRGRSRQLGRAGLVLIGVLPLITVANALWPGLAPVEGLLSLWFDLHCERDPARMLSLAGVPLAVCARCAGIYFGLGAGALVARPRLTARGLRRSVVAGALLMLVDVQLERHGVHGPSASLRVVTGLLLAYPLGAALGMRLGRIPPRLDAQSP